MEKAGQQLKDLNEKFEAITKRIEAIPEEIIETEKRTKEREFNLERILRDIEEVRKQRQGLLVTGGKVDEVSARIKTLWEKCDLAEDEILGLKGKVRELHVEEVKILEDKKSCIDEIIKASLGPLVEVHNVKAKALSDTLKEIFSLMDGWGISFGEEGWGRFISPSSWIGLRALSRLSMKGEPVGKDFINFTEIYQNRAQEQMERHAQSIRDAKGIK